MIYLTPVGGENEGEKGHKDGKHSNNVGGGQPHVLPPHLWDNWRIWMIYLTPVGGENEGEKGHKDGKHGNKVGGGQPLSSLYPSLG
jgi:hypothetical protein